MLLLLLCTVYPADKSIYTTMLYCCLLHVDLYSDIVLARERICNLLTILIFVKFYNYGITIGSRLEGWLNTLIEQYRQNLRIHFFTQCSMLCILSVTF